MRGTNGYCDAQAEEVLRGRLGESWGTGTVTHPLHFIDHGNYHYLSKLYTDMINEPFHLVVFDHHTDMQDAAFGGLLSCGSWVKEVMETNAFVKGVTIVGAECGAESESWGTGTVTHPLYISIDKDVLSPSEVLTNWDQGEMTADELFAQLDELRAHHEILGIDVCGDASLDMDPSILKRAVPMNDALNARFIEWFLQRLP